MLVPVAESQLSVNTASSARAAATTGGTRSTSLSRNGTAKRGAESPFRNTLNGGRPHTKTATERSSHGSQASRTARRDGAAVSASTAVPASGRAHVVRGFHHRSSSARAAIETTADTTSTSHG